jgi:hypothetical protein
VIQARQEDLPRDTPTVYGPHKWDFFVLMARACRITTV